MSCRPIEPAAAPAWRARACVLDARDEAAFARGHLPGAGRMSTAEFRARRPELPPRTQPVLVVHDDAVLARAAAGQLEDMGYREVAWLDAPVGTLADGVADHGPPARLWRPSPFLERCLPVLARGRALDLAGGTSRESVFLAMHGWEAEVWDHDPDALARASDLAQRHGVRLATRVIGVGGGMAESARAWDLIVVCRFLDRTVFPWIECSLAPGGTLVYETFRRGQEAHGRPRQARFLLEPGELASAFPSLVVERYEESDAPGGPVMAHLLARRPPGC